MCSLLVSNPIFCVSHNFSKFLSSNLLKVENNFCPSVTCALSFRNQVGVTVTYSHSSVGEVSDSIFGVSHNFSKFSSSNLLKVEINFAVTNICDQHV